MEKRTIKTELITAYITNNKLSKTAFCKLCKISLNTLNKILDNNHNINILALFKIAKVMELQIHELFG